MQNIENGGVLITHFRQRDVYTGISKGEELWERSDLPCLHKCAECSVMRANPFLKVPKVAILVTYKLQKEVNGS